MHEHCERFPAPILLAEANALEVHHALRAGEAVDLAELRRLRILEVHPLGCHFLWTQSAWCGAFLVLDHSSSIGTQTSASSFFIFGVVVSTVSSRRWPFGSKK